MIYKFLKLLCNNHICQENLKEDNISEEKEEDVKINITNENENTLSKYIKLDHFDKRHLIQTILDKNEDKEFKLDFYKGCILDENNISYIYDQYYLLAIDFKVFDNFHRDYLWKNKICLVFNDTKKIHNFISEVDYYLAIINYFHKINDYSYKDCHEELTKNYKKAIDYFRTKDEISIILKGDNGYLIKFFFHEKDNELKNYINIYKNNIAVHQIYINIIILEKILNNFKELSNNIDNVELKTYIKYKKSYIIQEHLKGNMDVKDEIYLDKEELPDENDDEINNSDENITILIQKLQKQLINLDDELYDIVKDIINFSKEINKYLENDSSHKKFVKLYLPEIINNLDDFINIKTNDKSDLLNKLYDTLSNILTALKDNIEFNYKHKELIINANLDALIMSLKIKGLI